ncbi:hypothetical protein DPMN_077767 [Dreissena polymorpha]|uniref:Uncharacterized protein n=1 Tax=Dreissena polymorpha TaxID=45954 RepID=A0A9D3YMK7_DREPO|nr:hypothetical protein DPMN_077767 [Dreissena polymorpha]
MGIKAFPHSVGPGMPHVWGQTTSESLKFSLRPRGAQLTCVANRRYYIGLVLAVKTYALGFIFAQG